MKLSIKVKTVAKAENVEKVDEHTYKVSVTAQPEKGRANEAVREALAKHFGVAKSRIRITAGHTAKTKLVNID